ncbi:MAG: hypothetical protein V7782_02750 [Psychromonas sp.]
MKKTNIFIACLLVTAPFVVADDYKYTEDQMGTVLLTQLQTQDSDKLQTQDRKQLKAIDSDQLQDPTLWKIDKDDPAYLQAMHQHQFNKHNAMSIQNMIQDAQVKGLPTEPMQNKVHEGIAKKADEEAIVRAVKQVQNRYENAYQNARGLSEDKQQVQRLGNQFAEANAAGFTNENAAQIMEQLQDQTKEMDRTQAYELAHESIKGIRNMTRQGVPSSTATDVYSNALKHAYQVKDMQTLQQSFAKQAKHSSPENVANGFSREIGQGVTAGGLGKSGSNKDSAGTRTGSGSNGGKGSGGNGSGGSGSGGSGGSGKS